MSTDAASRSRPWAWAQGALLLATAAFVAAVLARPQPSMTLFWNVVVPLLPLSFLLSPVVWRSICPLATLNMLVSWPGGRKLSGQVSRWAGLPSMVALAVLVPLRHLAFNTEPWALVLLIVIAAAAAIASGMLFDARAGFCNLVCPVLPVERLYGQRPVIDVGSPRCSSCSVCTPRGCPDLALDKALPQLMGPHRKTQAWLTTATGLFACAFPGFIAGYFLVAPHEVHSVATVYGRVLGGAALSLAVLWGLLRLVRAPSTRALPVLAALSAATYFWFAVPGTAGALGLAGGAVVAGRVILLVVVSAWLAFAWRSAADVVAPLVQVVVPPR